MALSPTGIPGEAEGLPLDWERQLEEVILAGSGGHCDATIEATLLLDCELESVSTSPLCSPFSLNSPISEASSSDSGFEAGLPVSAEDDLLLGLFGPDFLLSQSQPAPQTTPTESVALNSTATIVRKSARISSQNIPTKHIPTANSLHPTQQQSSMYELDFEDPPSYMDECSTSTPPTSDQQLDKNRKNAESARLNRIKKKKYVEELEKDRSRARADNVILRTRCTELAARNRKLENEVDYLRSVLANQSTLASLIKNIPGTPGVTLTSSFSRKRPSNQEDGGSVTANKRQRRSGQEVASPTASQQKSGGVCLHVSKGTVSLEFCSQCSQQAIQS